MNDPAPRRRRPAPFDDGLSTRKVPRQRRSRLTVEAILEAATRVLRTESLAGFNTNLVAEVAGVSVGSLYQYFPNKEALVAALSEATQLALADALEAQVAELGAASLEVGLKRLTALAVRQQYADPVLAAALDHEERRLLLHERNAPARRRIVAAIDGFLRPRLPGLPTAAAGDCLVIARAMVEADLDHRAAIPRSPPEDLAARVECALAGYLDRVTRLRYPGAARGRPGAPSRRA